MFKHVTDIIFACFLRPDRAIRTKLKIAIGEMHVGMSERGKFCVEDVVGFFMINFGRDLAYRFTGPVLELGSLSIPIYTCELMNDSVEILNNLILSLRPVILPKKVHRLSPLGIFTAAMFLTCIHCTLVQDRSELDVLRNTFHRSFRDVVGCHINLKHRASYRISHWDGVPFTAK